MASAGASQDVVEQYEQIVNLGILGQEQVGYNDWAFVTVGGRWDRNSAFGANTSGAFYPKVSFSLVVSDLPGWSNTTLSTVRLRGALGRSGLQPGAFAKFTTFGALVGYDPVSGTALSGLAPVNLGNANLKPEVTRELEGGAEVAFFNNRLGFDVTKWDRKTKDALVAKQYAPTGGFRRTQLSNIGELVSNGWEIKVNAAVIDRRNFSVNLFGNTAYLFQKVASMGGAAPIKVGGSYDRYRNFIKEGYVIGALLGAKLQYTSEGIPAFCTSARCKADGVPDTRAELEQYLSSPRTLSTFLDPKGIGPWLVDENGDGDFLDNCLGPSKADGTCMAKSWPDWSGSFGASVTLQRSWQISTLLEYKTGNYILTNLTDAFRKANPTIGRNVKYTADLESTIENPASTAAARTDALINYVNTQLALAPYAGLNQSEDGKFLRLREVGITYTAPQSFAQRLGLNNLAFNLTGRDLLLFTPYTGIDPELNQYSRGSSNSAADQNFGEGIDAWGFPLPRRFTFSVRFGF